MAKPEGYETNCYFQVDDDKGLVCLFCQRVTNQEQELHWQLRIDHY